MPLKRKILLAAVLLPLLAVAGWTFSQPGDDFGVCRFGLTTYDRVPWLAVDIQVAADDQVRRVEKTHDLRKPALDWLLQSNPEILIVAEGWDGVVQVADVIRAITDCEVEVLRTGEAIERFRALKRQGKRVAIHVHSTC